MTYFYLSVAVLAALLFLPVARLIWVMSVRRLERRLRRVLKPLEVEAQRRRAYVIALPVCLAFSYLFNLQLLGAPFHG